MSPLSLSHIALHYPASDDGRQAAKLLSLLGLTETQSLPLADGHFYRFVVDARRRARGDGIIYLSVVPDAQRRLTETVRAALKVGEADEHPAVGGLRAAMAADPEYTFHVGILMESLETLERTVEGLLDQAEADPELKGRLKFTFNRARRGDADVDARLDASPIFGAVDRYAYGRNGVQAFIETDLLVSGPLGESLVLELDYVFPNKASHILSDVEL